MKTPSVRSFGSLVSKVKALVDADLNRALREAGLELTPEQWAILIAVHASPGLTQADICRQTYKDAANVTRLLNLLVRRGWAERREHEHDRRAFSVHLTAAGTATVRRVVPIASATNERIAAGLGAADSETLLDLLERVRTVLALQAIVDD
jgi:DNA-binding MarR family transcriptional regulator